MATLLRRLRSEAGDFGTYIAGVITVILIGVAFGLGANVVHLVSGQGTLTNMAQAAAKEVAIQGCLTSQDVSAVQNQLQSLGWNSANLHTSASFSATQPQGNYGSTVTVGMDYNMPIVMFGTIKAGSWLLSATGSAPMQYVQPVGTSSSTPVCPGTSYSGSTTPVAEVYTDTMSASTNPSAGTLTFTQGSYSPASGSSGSSSTGSGAVTMTLAASPASTTVGGTVEFTGQVMDGSTPHAGATVNISGGGAATTAMTDSNGDYQAALSFTATGTFTITASTGGATTTTQVTVAADSPAQVTVSAQTPVADGSNEVIYATVTDQNGNPVADGTQVQVSSTDSTDVPSQTLTTSNGEVALGVNWTQVGTWTVTFTSQGVSGSASVTVQPGGAQNLTLSASPDPAAAGQQVTMSGTVTDSEGNPVATGTSVTVSSPTDPAECPRQTVATGSGGTFSATCTFTVAGSQSLSATSGSATGSTTVTVTAGAASQFVGVALAPDPVDSGSELSAAGTLEDPYGNPVSGATVTMSGAGASDGTGTTASNGAFAVNIIPASTGQQTITLVSGSATWTGTVTVNSPSSSDVVAAWVGSPGTTQVSVPAGSSVTLGMTITSGGSGVSGEQVTFAEPFVSGGGTWTCTTGANGECSVAATGFTQTGDIVVQAAIPNGETSDVQVEVTAGAPANIAGFACSPTILGAGSTTSCSGTVTDAYGNAVSGSTVFVSGGGGTASPVTSSTGYFNTTLTITAAGTDTITAKDGSATASTTVTVTAGAPAGAIVTDPAKGGTYYYGEPFQVTVQLADQYGNPITSLPSGEDYSIGIANADNAGNAGPYCDLVGPTSTTYCTWQIGGYGAAPVNVPYTGYGYPYSNWGSGPVGSVTGPDSGTWVRDSVVVNSTNYGVGYYSGSTSVLSDSSYGCISADNMCSGFWYLAPQYTWTGTTWYTAFQEAAGQESADTSGDGGINYEVPSQITAGFAAGEDSALPPLPASSVPGSTVTFTEQTFMPSQVYLTVSNPTALRDNEIEVGGAYGYQDAGNYCATVSQTNPYGVALNVGIMQDQPNQQGKGNFFDISPGEATIANGGSAVVCGGSSNGITSYPTEAPHSIIVAAAPLGESPFLPGVSSSYASTAVVWGSTSYGEWYMSPSGAAYENGNTWVPVTFYLEEAGITGAVGQTESVSCTGYSGDQVTCPGSVTVTSSATPFTVDVYVPYGTVYGNVMVNVTVGPGEVVSTDVNFYN